MDCLYCHNPLRPQDVVFCPICGGAVPDPPLKPEDFAYEWYVSWEGPKGAELVRGLAQALETRGVLAYIPDRSNPPLDGKDLEQIIGRCRVLVLLPSNGDARSPEVGREVTWWVRHREKENVLAVMDVAAAAEARPQLGKVAALGPGGPASLLELLSKPFSQIADAPPLSAPSRASQSVEPGEFTRMFQAQPSPKTSPPEPPPPSDEIEKAFGLRQPAPGAYIRDVRFTLTAPSCLPPGSHSELTVWCHPEGQQDAVLQRAMLSLDAAEETRPDGTKLNLTVTIEGLSIDPAHAEVNWAGEIAGAAFIVAVPENASEGVRPASVSVRADGADLGKISFELMVRHAAGKLSVIHGEMSRSLPWEPR